VIVVGETGADQESITLPKSEVPEIVGAVGRPL
jgi:hypothetical protein